MLKQFAKNIRFLLRNDLGNNFADLQKTQNVLLRTVLPQVDPWFSESRGIAKNQRCFLLGCGPSLNRTDLSKTAGFDVMAVNGAGFLDEIDVKYFVSVSNFFWKSHEDEIRNLKCRRFLPENLRSELESDAPTVWLNGIADEVYNTLDVDKPWQFGYDPSKAVFLGGTVIFVCLQILYYLGYSEVVILGLDHDYGVGRDEIPKKGAYVSSDRLTAHFRKDYYRQGEQVHIDIHGMERAYQLARDAYDADGRRIINASPGSKLSVFEKGCLEELV